MNFTTNADPYISGNSKKWKNWQSNYKEPKTCMICEDDHGRIYPYLSPTYALAHQNCRCKIIPMRTKKVGAATESGWDGADAWLMYRKRLPDNYITKKEALELGWSRKKKNLAEKCPGKTIGGDLYMNDKSKLPDALNRVWREADFDFISGKRNRKRILYSNDGLIFISYDHAQTFYELVK